MPVPALLGFFIVLFIAMPSLAGEAEDGAKIFKSKCDVCHGTVAGKHKVGPSLFGVVGRKAGTAEGFGRYRGLKDAGWIWDADNLDPYLADPVTYTRERNGRRTNMVLKLSGQEDRDAVIAYLKTLK